MIFPSVVPTLMENRFNKDSLEVIHYVIIFVTYFGLAFIATFFNVCVVYTAKVRFEGGNATFGESVRFALSRIALIAQWSLISASVGLLLRVLHNLASRLPRIGQIIANILISLMGMAWSIMTLFVVPVLVYEGLGPIDAIKRSAEVIKKTWGESLIKTIGLGIIQFVVFFVIILASVGLTLALSNAFGVTGVVVGVGTGLLLVLLAGLIFTVANTIYNTALYLYANNGQVAEGFSQEIVQNALRQKND